MQNSDKLKEEQMIEDKQAYLKKKERRENMINAVKDIPGTTANLTKKAFGYLKSLFCKMHFPKLIFLFFYFFYFVF